MNSFWKQFLVFVTGSVTTVLILCAGYYLLVNVYWDYDYEDLDGEYAAESSMSSMRELVINLEGYKNIFGIYPVELDDATGPYDSNYDPAATHCGCPYSFQYQVSENGLAYYLRSKGEDCTAFTEDDLLPRLSAAELAQTGLLTDLVAGQTPLPIGCGG